MHSATPSQRLDMMMIISRMGQASWLGVWALAMLSPSLQSGLFGLGAISLNLWGRTFSAGPLHVILIMAALTWALDMPLLAWRRRLHLGPGLTALPVLGFGVLTVARIWPVHDPRAAWVAAGSTLVFWMAYLQGVQGLPLGSMMGALACVCLLQGGVAVAQATWQRSIGLQWLGEAVLDPQAQGVSVVQSMGQRWLRAHGLMAHPNILGGYLALMICVLAGLYLDHLGDSRRRAWRIGVGGSIAVGLAALLLSFSRSGWLGMLVGLAYMAALARRGAGARLLPGIGRSRFLVATAFLLCAATAALGWGLLRSRLLLERNILELSSVSERLIDVGLAWQLIRTLPLKGVGPGYYVAALWAHMGNQLGPGYPGFRVVHNIPLLAAAELGLGGAIFWLWMVMSPPFLTLRRLRPKGASWAQIGLAAALLVALVVSLFDNYFYIPTSWRPALSLGLVLGLWAHEDAAPAPRAP
ncbi:MAG: O-antigen ligase family protein [Anaerolineae bacterium]|nr:O-antigen ligase family protein [Anaerolineae bacterium]